jgi:3-oxoacyl-[acyl-carrier protein] reductase
VNSKRLIHIKTDFFDDESFLESLEEIKNISFNVLINNSGGPESKPFTEVTQNDFLREIKSHLLTAHEVTKLVVPKMKKNQFGRIINIVSVTAKIPLPNMIVSNTIRGAILNWAKTLSKELGGTGITVNNLLPGYTKTERLEEVVTSAAKSKGVDSEVIFESLLGQIPEGRFGEAEELANLACFLSTVEASYINGQSIAVDGGWTACN